MSAEGQISTPAIPRARSVRVSAFGRRAMGRTLIVSSAWPSRAARAEARDKSAGEFRIERWVYAALPCLGALVVVGLAAKYRLDERRVYEIKQALERRSGT